jgi:hypothetical protein
MANGNWFRYKRVLLREKKRSLDFVPLVFELTLKALANFSPGLLGTLGSVPQFDLTLKEFANDLKHTLANTFGVRIFASCRPRVQSNPGLELANAFSVILGL